MNEVDNRRLCLVMAKNPLLAPTATLEVTSLNGVEWKKPYSVVVQPADPQRPRGSISDEPILIELLSAKVADYNAMRSSNPTIVTSIGALEEKLAGCRSRDQILTSLRRLHNTQVSTHYAPHGERRKYTGTLLEHLGVQARGHLEIRLSQLLMEQITRRQLLKAPTEYHEAKGLRRRVWALCLAFCGRGRASWTMPVTEVWRRSGSTNELRKFIYAFRQLIAADEIPGYRLTIAEGRPQPVVIEHAPPSFAPIEPNYQAQPSVHTIDLYLDLEPQPEVPREIVVNYVDLFPEG